MGCDTELVAQVGDAGGAHEVDLDRSIEGRVETHRRRRVDDDVTGREQLSPGGIETETITTDIAGHRGDAPCGHLGETLRTEFGTEPVEGVVLEDLAGQTLLDGGAASGAHEQHELTVGDRAQESFEQVGAEEAGGAGHEQTRAGEGVSDHE